MANNGWNLYHFVVCYLLCSCLQCTRHNCRASLSEKYQSNKSKANGCKFILCPWFQSMAHKWLTKSILTPCNKHPKKWPKIHFYKGKFGMRLVKSICVVCIGRLYIHSVLQVRLSFVGYPSERTYIQFEKLTPIINY